MLINILARNMYKFDDETMLRVIIIQSVNFPIILFMLLTVMSILRYRFRNKGFMPYSDCIRNIFRQLKRA